MNSLNTKLSLLILLISYTSIYSLSYGGSISFQQPPLKEECNCQEVFDELVVKLESNYLVFKKMQMQNKLSDYYRKKEVFKKQVITTDMKECTETLQKFLNQFEDGHLYVIERPKYSDEELENIKNKIKSQTVDLAFLEEKLKTEEIVNEADKIIGTYTDGQSQVGIIKENEMYKAYILSSKKEGVETGELKAIFMASEKEKGYSGTYYSYGYQPRYERSVLFKENTILKGGFIWGKVKPNDSREVRMLNTSNPSLPTITKLDDQNVLFSIPRFSGTPAKDFMKVLKDNSKIWKEAENLIIDIRGNRGGNAIYFNFIGAYATEKSLPESQGEVLASEDTKKYYERKKYNPKIFEPLIERITNNMGEIVPGPKYFSKKIKSQSSKIKTVAILTDGACMSAAESFILHSKLISSKVKTFGAATAGVIDYTSVNGIRLNSSGSQNIIFGYPTSSWGNTNDEKYPDGYNKTGILPDVPIENSVEDKVKFIVDYYYKEQNK